MSSVGDVEAIELFQAPEEDSPPPGELGSGFHPWSLSTSILCGSESWVRPAIIGEEQVLTGPMRTTVGGLHEQGSSTPPA